MSAKSKHQVSTSEMELTSTPSMSSQDKSSLEKPTIDSKADAQPAFFPWLEDDGFNDLKLSKKVVKRFPLLGAAGLLGLQELR